MIETIFGQLLTSGLVTGKSLLGCNSEEISTVESHFGRTLPIEYREFLSIAGRAAGRLFQGTDIFYPRLLALQQAAKDLLGRRALEELLPDQAMVFCMHQGYEFEYFLPGSDDPPVYQFWEGQTEIVVPWATFSDFVIEAVKNDLDTVILT